jgi:hypothetical protein
MKESLELFILGSGIVQLLMLSYLIRLLRKIKKIGCSHHTNLEKLKK